MSINNSDAHIDKQINAFGTNFFGSAGPSIHPFMAPLPEAMVDREGRCRAIRQSLCGPQSPRVTVLHGWAGSGKTAIAIALAHELRHAFDGVLWVRLGENPDVLAGIVQWCAACRMPAREFNHLATPQQHQFALQSLIGDQRILLVIDDAWSEEAVKPFLAGGRNCTHLITTQLPSVAAAFAPREARHLVKPLEPEQALELLRTLAPDTCNEFEKKVRKLIARVGTLPAVVHAMGKHLGAAEESALPADLLRAIKRLAESLQPTPYADPKANEVHAAVFDIYRSSEAALDEEARRALRAVARLAPSPNTFTQEAAMEIAASGDTTLKRLVSYGFLDRRPPERYAMPTAASLYLAWSHQPPVPGQVDRDDLAARRMTHYFVDVLRTNGNDADAIEPDIDNIVSALRWSAEHGEPRDELADGIVLIYPLLEKRGLDSLDQMRQHLLEPAARVACALAEQRPGDVEAHLRQLRAMLYAARAAEKCGHNHTAKQWLQRARQQIERQAIGDALLLCDLHLAAAWAAYSLSNYDAATRSLDDAQAALTNSPDRHRANRILQRRGEIALSLGDYDAAEAYLQRGLDEARSWRKREKEAEAGLHVALAWVAYDAGKYQPAFDRASDGLPLAEGRFRERECALRHALGAAACKLELHDRSEAEFKQAMRLARRLNHRWYLAAIFTERGWLSLRRHRSVAARRAFLTARRLAEQIDSPDRRGFALHGLSHALRTLGDGKGAIEAAAESHKVFSSIRHAQAKSVAAWLDELVPSPDLRQAVPGVARAVVPVAPISDVGDLPPVTVPEPTPQEHETVGLELLNDAAPADATAPEKSSSQADGF